MLEFVLLVAFFGVVVGLIAQAKGRSFPLWFLYGAGFFIVAIVHVLVLKPDRREAERQALADGMKRCEHCAEIIQGAAKVCRHCGRDVHYAEPQPVAADAGFLG